MGTLDTKYLWRQEVIKMLGTTMTIGQIVRDLEQDKNFCEDFGLDYSNPPTKQIREYVMGMRTSFSMSQSYTKSNFSPICLRRNSGL